MASAANTANVATNDARLTALEVPPAVAPYLHLAGIIDWSGAAYVVRALSGDNSTNLNIGALVPGGAGFVNVSALVALPTGWRPVYVVVTPTQTPGGLYANAAPSGSGAAVWLYDAAGVATNGGFNIAIWAKKD